MAKERIKKKKKKSNKSKPKINQMDTKSNYKSGKLVCFRIKKEKTEKYTNGVGKDSVW